MSDLEIAKTLLIEKRLTLIIVRNGRILFETNSNGISGFLNAIEKLDEKLENAAIADKIAGKAIALLCIYAGISKVYAVTLSTKAREVLERNGLFHEWTELVDNILDEKKQNICPFEKEAANISKPEEAYRKLKALQRKFRACK